MNKPAKESMLQDIVDEMAATISIYKKQVNIHHSMLNPIMWYYKTERHPDYCFAMQSGTEVARIWLEYEGTLTLIRK